MKAEKDIQADAAQTLGPVSTPADRLREMLDEALDNAVTPEDRADERWTITNASAANWAMAKLRQAKRRLAEAESLAAEQHDLADRFLDGERGRIGPEITNWETRLIAWHRAELNEHADRKTIRLPSGTLSARRLPDGVVIEDEAAFCEWAFTNSPDLVTVKTSPNRVQIKQAVLNDGEILPGVTPVEGDIRFSVKTEDESMR